MAVPKAAMNQDHCFVARQNYIRLTRQGRIVKTEPKPPRVEALAQNQFRSCVCGPDSRHHPAANFGCNDVSHALKSAPGLVG